MRCVSFVNREQILHIFKGRINKHPPPSVKVFAAKRFLIVMCQKNISAAG